MAAGEKIGCFGLTEPDHGSDPGGMKTRAKKDGNDWVINGAKLWITNGDIADVELTKGSKGSWWKKERKGS
jgi:glutaryl-CoA dehydrogenase